MKKWFFNAIGSLADAAIRYRNIQRVESYHNYPGIHKGARFMTDGRQDSIYIAKPESAKIGKGCIFICQNIYIGNSCGFLEIGNFSHFGRGLTILTFNHNFNGDYLPYIPPYEGGDVAKNVTIGSYIWCGANVSICPGVTIGDGAVLGLGAVITKDVPPLAVVGGNPARVIKYRDKKIYEANVAGQHTWGWKKRVARAEKAAAQAAAEAAKGS